MNCHRQQLSFINIIYCCELSIPLSQLTVKYRHIRQSSKTSLLKAIIMEVCRWQETSRRTEIFVNWMIICSPFHSALSNIRKVKLLWPRLSNKYVYVEKIWNMQNYILDSEYNTLLPYFISSDRTAIFCGFECWETTGLALLLATAETFKRLNSQTSFSNHKIAD